MHRRFISPGAAGVGFTYCPAVLFVFAAIIAASSGLYPPYTNPDTSPVIVSPVVGTLRPLGPAALLRLTPAATGAWIVPSDASPANQRLGA